MCAPPQACHAPCRNGRSLPSARVRQASWACRCLRETMSDMSGQAKASMGVGVLWGAAVGGETARWLPPLLGDALPVPSSILTGLVAALIAGWWCHACWSAILARRSRLRWAGMWVVAGPLAAALGVAGAGLAFVTAAGAADQFGAGWLSLLAHVETIGPALAAIEGLITAVLTVPVSFVLLAWCSRQKKVA